MAEKWCKEWHKIEILRKGWETYQHKEWQGITNMKVGPPTFLEADIQSKWKAEIIRAMRDCVRDYWIPFQNRRLILRWTDLRNVLVNNVYHCSTLVEGEDGLGELKAVAKGIGSAISRQCRSNLGLMGEIRDGRGEGLSIPPPPLQHKEQQEEGEALGQGLKRGVRKGAINSQFRVWEELGYSIDPIDIIARGIYGCRKREKLVYISIIKYMDKVYEGGNSFKSRQALLRKGGRRRINTYIQYRHLLYRQEIWVGREEFRIITLLYQVQIRIFREGNRNGRSNVVCTEEIGQNYGRVVDLVYKQGEWATLCRVEDREGYQEGVYSTIEGETVRQGGRRTRMGEIVETVSNMEDSSREIGIDKQRVEEGIYRKWDREERQEGQIDIKLDGWIPYKSVDRVGREVGQEKITRSVLDRDTLDKNIEEGGQQKQKRMNRIISEVQQEGSVVDVVDKDRSESSIEERGKQKQRGEEIYHNQGKAERQTRRIGEVANCRVEHRREVTYEVEVVSEVESDKSSVDLIDKSMLDRLMLEVRQQEQIIDRIREKGGGVDNGEGEYEIDSDKSATELLDRNTLHRYREECRQKEQKIDKNREEESEIDNGTVGESEVATDKQRGEEGTYCNWAREGRQEGKRDIGMDGRMVHRREDRVGREARSEKVIGDILDRDTSDISIEERGKHKQKSTNSEVEQEERVMDLVDKDMLESSIGEEGKQKQRKEEASHNQGIVGRQASRLDGVGDIRESHRGEAINEVEVASEAGSDRSSVDLIDKSMLDRLMEGVRQQEQRIDRTRERGRGVDNGGEGEYEIESDNSSIVLLDKSTLERFREELRQQEQGREKNREEGGKADNGKVGESEVEPEGSLIDVIGKSRLYKEGEERRVKRKKGAVSIIIQQEGEYIRDIDRGEEQGGIEIRWDDKKGGEKEREERYSRQRLGEQDNNIVEEIQIRLGEMHLEDRSRVEIQGQNKDSVKQYEEGEGKKMGKVGGRVELDTTPRDLSVKGRLDTCKKHSTEMQSRKDREQVGRRQKTQSSIAQRIGEDASCNSRGGRDKQDKQERDESKSNKRGKTLIGRKVKQIREEESEGSNGEEGGGTNSSIEALFVDKHLEREGKKIGKRQVTRRMVWERWRGIVRGASRRVDRRKSKAAKEAEKQKEENKVVFDYTTKGLTVEEIRLLGKGEAFCVVDHKIDEDRNRVDIYQYQRRLRLHEVFRDPGEGEEEERVEICTPVAESRNERSRRDRGVGSNISSIRRTTLGRGGRESINNISREGEGRGGGPNRGVTHSGNSRARGGRSTRGISNEHHNGVEGAQNLQGRRSIAHIGTRSTREERTGTLNTGLRGIGTPGVNRRLSRGSTIGRNAVREGTQNVVEEGSTNVFNREGMEGKAGRHLPSIYDPDSHNRNLQRYNNCIQEEISLAMEGKEVEFKDNITREERKALKVLKQRIAGKEIIITRADKGSGLVAVDYDKYIEKGTKYIEEEAGAYNIVQETEQAIIGRLTKERNKIAEQLKERGVIELQTATYVKKQLEDKITGIKFFYKIHKDRRIESMPLRPLQLCIKAPTQHLSIVLTDILQPLLTDKNIPSFIFDSNQLLFRLCKLGKIPNDCTLISSDVSALYPSIPHQEGFRAMRSFLGDRTTYNSRQIDSLIRALELVITENFMTWNRQIYKQVSGVAMGTPVAVAYANIFMNWVDMEVRGKAPFIHEHIRYIDDNLFILPEDRVEELMGIANNILPPHIKFTYEKLQPSSGKGLPFLDAQLFIGVDKRIESRLYTKATDRHAYLLPSSYHPPHITRNIPLAVFGRLRKICSKEEWFEEDAKKAEGWLENRGYSKEGIQKALAKTRLRDRWGMIEQIEKNRDKEIKKKEETTIDIPFIMTYNQHVKKIRQILRDRQPLLDSAFKKTKVRPRLSYRRKRNLNDIIVQKGLRGPIEDSSKELNIFSKCGDKPGYRTRCPCKGRHSQVECRCCMHSIGAIDNVESKLCKPVNCNSRNIVYIIECRECKKKYVGETQQRLKDRLAQHMYNVDKLNQPLYLHFRSVHKLESLRIGVVETVRGVEPFMRKVREAWWVNHLKTLEPDGFNVKLECNQVYEGTR